LVLDELIEAKPFSQSAWRGVAIFASLIIEELTTKSGHELFSEGISVELSEVTSILECKSQHSDSEKYNNYAGGFLRYCFPSPSPRFV
jgi:hypothetical protein